MRTSYLSMATWAALASGIGLMLAGSLIATEVGSLMVGYGLLVVLAGSYLGAGLAIRDRVRRAGAARRELARGQSLLGRRVF